MTYQGTAIQIAAGGVWNDWLILTEAPSSVKFISAETFPISVMAFFMITGSPDRAHSGEITENRYRERSFSRIPASPPGFA